MPSQQLALNVSLSGQTLFQAGATAVPYTMGAAGPTPFKAIRERRDSAPAAAQAFTALAEAGYESLYEQAFADVNQRALRFGDTVSAALAGTPDFASLPDVATRRRCRGWPCSCARSPS